MNPDRERSTRGDLHDAGRTTLRSSHGQEEHERIAERPLPRHPQALDPRRRDSDRSFDDDQRVLAGPFASTERGDHRVERRALEVVSHNTRSNGASGGGFAAMNAAASAVTTDAAAAVAVTDRLRRSDSSASRLFSTSTARAALRESASMASAPVPA